MSERKIVLPPKFEALARPKRRKVYYGGRGGAKTCSICLMALLKSIQDDWCFLCLREFMNSIEESVHAELVEMMELYGLREYFEVQKTAIINKRSGKTAFSFGQLNRNLASIKGKTRFNVFWVEEGETISEKSLEFLIPTLRKKGSELWISFNPADEFGPVYSRFVRPYEDEILENGFYEDDVLHVCRVNLEDNPYATEELKLESRECKERDYKEWLHVWGGEPVRDYSEVLIKPEWVKASIDAHKKLNFEPRGMRALGFDPADVGKDAKAIAGRYGVLVDHLEAWRNGDLSDAIAKAFATYREKKADAMVYDYIGVGTGVKVAADRDDPMRRMKLFPFIGSGKVERPLKKWREKSNKDTFKNLRAQYYWYLAARFEATYNAVEKGIYTDPDDMISLSGDLDLLDKLRGELSAVRRVYRPGFALLQVESKEEMIKRGVKSPNLADALVYSFAAKMDEITEDVEINLVTAWE